MAKDRLLIEAKKVLQSSSSMESVNYLRDFFMENWASPPVDIFPDLRPVLLSCFKKHQTDRAISMVLAEILVTVATKMFDATGEEWTELLDYVLLTSLKNQDPPVEESGLRVLYLFPLFMTPQFKAYDGDQIWPAILRNLHSSCSHRLRFLAFGACRRLLEGIAGEDSMSNEYIQQILSAMLHSVEDSIAVAAAAVEGVALDGVSSLAEVYLNELADMVKEQMEHERPSARKIFLDADLLVYVATPMVQILQRADMAEGERNAAFRLLRLVGYRHPKMLEDAVRKSGSDSAEEMVKAGQILELATTFQSTESLHKLLGRVADSNSTVYKSVSQSQVGANRKGLHINCISNILFRLPVKSLKRMQSVHKSWKEIITSPSFLLQHGHCLSIRMNCKWLTAVIDNLIILHSGSRESCIESVNYLRDFFMENWASPPVNHLADLKPVLLTCFKKHQADRTICRVLVEALVTFATKMFDASGEEWPELLEYVLLTTLEHPNPAVEESGLLVLYLFPLFMSPQLKAYDGDRIWPVILRNLIRPCTHRIRFLAFGACRRLLEGMAGEDSMSNGLLQQILSALLQSVEDSIAAGDSAVDGGSSLAEVYLNELADMVAEQMELEEPSARKIFLEPDLLVYVAAPMVEILQRADVAEGARNAAFQLLRLVGYRHSNILKDAVMKSGSDSTEKKVKACQILELATTWQLDEDLNPHLADFGFTVYQKDLKGVSIENWRSTGKPPGGFHKKNMVGTLIYMAPEILRKEIHIERSDV